MNGTGTEPIRVRRLTNSEGAEVAAFALAALAVILAASPAASAIALACACVAARVAREVA